MAKTPSLTHQLYTLNPTGLQSATQHPFLARAGNGSLPNPILCTWLVQDKYYQLAYLNFIGNLIAKVPIFPPPYFRSGEEEKLIWTTLDILIGALTNIRREIDFYAHTVGKYNLPVKDATPNSTTMKYVELFEAVGGGKEYSLMTGLVLLWATERCYLDAWSYASTQMKTVERASLSENDGGIAALYDEFIPNWTSEPFHAFVEDLASVTDAWATRLGMKETETSGDIWSTVLELEAEFWPDV